MTTTNCYRNELTKTQPLFINTNQNEKNNILTGLAMLLFTANGEAQDCINSIEKVLTNNHEVTLIGNVEQAKCSR